MKKLIFVATLALMLASCSKENKETKADQSVCRFHTVTTDRQCKYELPDSIKEMYGDGEIYAHLQASICWPDSLGGTAPKELQDSLLARTFKDFKATSIDSAITVFRTTPIGFEDLKSVKMTDVKQLPKGESLSEQIYKMSITVTPTRITDRIATFASSFTAYLGGAHGDYGTSYVNYDLTKNQVITAKRLFADMKQLKAAIMRQININPDYTGGIIVSEVPTVDNFYITDSFITFYYNPSEVGCYAVGTVIAELPIYELRDYMTAYGKQLFPESED